MFRGVFTALITPFHNYKIDYEALEALIERQIANGIDGLVPCGTTGEAPTLTEQEHRDIIEFTVKVVAKRIPIIAGTGSNSTVEALHYSRLAQNLGADAVLLTCPYYNKPSARGLRAHFLKIADEISIPQILYNIPSRTGINLLPETVLELSKHPRIVGIKEASGNLEQMIKIRKMCSPEFDVLSGDDTLTLPVLSIGGVGVISVFSNLLPKEMTSMVHLFLENQFVESQNLFLKYYDLIKNIMTTDANPVGIKLALSLCGQIQNELRLPLVEAQMEDRKKMEKLLNQAQLLPLEIPK
jgi:4-hydroxy-tetrahydrodipicolinate synthase